MATVFALHNVAKTEIEAVRRHSMDGKPFWAQEITVHFDDGRKQSINLYSNESPDALIALDAQMSVDEVAA